MESGAVGICCEAVAEGMGEARGPREAREVGACIYIAPEYALSGLYLYTYRYCTPDTTAIYVGTVHRRPASTRDSRIAVTTPARGFRTYDRALHATTAQGRPPRRLAPVSRSQLAGESPVAFPGESPVAFSGESPVAFPALSSASAVPPPRVSCHRAATRGGPSPQARSRQPRGAPSPSDRAPRASTRGEGQRETTGSPHNTVRRRCPRRRSC